MNTGINLDDSTGRMSTAPLIVSSSSRAITIALQQMRLLHSSRTHRNTSAAPVSQNPGSAPSALSEIQTLSMPRNPLAE